VKNDLVKKGECRRIFFLDKPFYSDIVNSDIIQVKDIRHQKMMFKSLRGNPVKIGNGPAAVTGDEGCTKSLSDINQTGRRSKRMIRKSEDLPE